MAAMETSAEIQSSVPVTPAAEPVAQVRHFGPSARALSQRQLLVLVVKGLTVLSLIVLLLMFQPPVWWAELLKWAIAAALAGGLWRAQGTALLTPIQQRSVLLHDQALELKRGDYRRFIVFSSLRHIQAFQGPDERMQSLLLHTDDGSLTVRDVEGLGEIFVALSAAKPQGVMIEIESRRVDWGEPLPWMLSLGAAALVIALMLWMAPWQKPAYLSGNGRLLIWNGAAIALWRPASRGSQWQRQAPEVLIGCLFFFFGQILLR